MSPAPAVFLLGTDALVAAAEGRHRRQHVGYAFFMADFDVLTELEARMADLEDVVEVALGSNEEWGRFAPTHWNLEEAVDEAEAVDREPPRPRSVPAKAFDEALLVVPALAASVPGHEACDVTIMVGPRFVLWEARVEGTWCFTRRLYRADLLGARLAAAPRPAISQLLAETVRVDPDWTLDILENGLRRVPRPVRLTEYASADVLRPFFESTDDRDALRAARLLGKVQPPGPKLRAQALSHPNRDVREAAILSLRRSAVDEPHTPDDRTDR